MVLDAASFIEDIFKVFTIGPELILKMARYVIRIIKVLHFQIRYHARHAQNTFMQKIQIKV